MIQVKFTTFPVLETARLQLKQVSKADASFLFKLRSDERVMKYLDRPSPSSEEEVISMIQKIEEALVNGQGISWGIFLKDQPAQLIGTIGFHQLTPAHFRAEIGYLLATKYHRQGIMTEAIQCVLNFGFYEMNLHSVEANINPSNLASQAILEKFGFRREAYFRENYFYNGKFLDSAIYSLLKPDWNKGGRN